MGYAMVEIGMAIEYLIMKMEGHWKDEEDRVGQEMTRMRKALKRAGIDPSPVDILTIAERLLLLLQQ